MSFRYHIVSDLPEWTVHDTETNCDIFPTTTNNRRHCLAKCNEHTARMIADAMNGIEELREYFATYKRIAWGQDMTDAEREAAEWELIKAVKRIVEGE